MSLVNLMDSSFSSPPVVEIRTIREVQKKSMPTKDEKNNFSISIESLAIKLELSYIEAITHYCDETGLEVEVAASLLNENLKSKVELEAQNLRYLPRGSKLPI